jgi:ABC-type glutathione transport system ATPase component
MDEIGALRDRGLAVVVATHDLSLVHDTADRVLALADGQVMFDGPPADLIADRRLLATVGQEPPVLDRLLCTARRMGAEVPRSVRWRDVLAVGAGRGRALTT